MRYVDSSTGTDRATLINTLTKRVIMFQLPDFPSIDFSALDLNAVRNSALGKRIAKIDLAGIDTDKVTAAVRDAAYLTVGIGVAAVNQARGLIRTAA
jgi:hypothetical protein